MLKLIHISLSVFLALATALGSNGLLLHKMACLTSGQVEFSVTADFDCGDLENEQSDQHSVEAICCDFDQVEFYISSFDLKQVDLQLPPALAPTLVIPDWYIPTNITTVLYEKLIPPLPVTERLSLICTYRI